MDALSVVSQLRDLASEPHNRQVIVQDQGCLPGLVLFLDHQSPDVLLATLQTLRYLAEMSPNIPIMKNELGMMVSLENLMGREGLSIDITSLASEVYDILNAANNPVPRTPERERRKKPQFFINSSNKKAKSVTLHIQGLDSSRGLYEVMIPLRASGVEVQQNTALPDYLPEDEESPERDLNRAISRTTAKEDSSGSWLNSAASFLTRTFYW